MPRKDASDLRALRSRLKSQHGRGYWRSLEELAGSAEFQQYLESEFPEGASQWNANRREFLTLMGASLALAGLSGCGGQPPEQIVPYVKQPKQLVPGKPLYFATAMTMGGIATGLLVESHMGRPTKIEGNPKHPSVPATFWQGNETTAPGVSDIYSPHFVYDDCTARQAADHMINHDIGRLPVIRREAPHSIVGIVTRSDILSAHRQRLNETVLDHPTIRLPAITRRMRGSICKY